MIMLRNALKLSIFTVVFISLAITWPAEAGSRKSGKILGVSFSKSGNLYGFSCGNHPKTQVKLSNVLKRSGSHWIQIGPILEGHITSLVCLNDNAIFLNGTFTAAGMKKFKNSVDFVMWNGRSFIPLNQETFPIKDYRITDMDPGPDNTLFVGGLDRSDYDKLPGFVAKWDGASWSLVGGLPQIKVYGMAVVSDKEIYVHGSSLVQEEKDHYTYYLKKWNGISWETISVNKTLEPEFYTLQDLQYHHGNLYAIEDISQEGVRGALPKSKLSKLVDNAWTQIGNGAIRLKISAEEESIDFVSQYNVSNKGDVIIIVHNYGFSIIAKLENNTWIPLGESLEGMHPTLLTNNKNELLAFGDFSVSGMITENNIAKWNGSSWMVGKRSVSFNVNWSYGYNMPSWSK